MWDEECQRGNSQGGRAEVYKLDLDDGSSSSTVLERRWLISQQTNSTAGERKPMICPSDDSLFKI